MSDPIQDYKIEAWTLFAIGGLVVFVRLYARWKVVGFSNFCLDDYLMVLALVSYISPFPHSSFWKMDLTNTSSRFI